MTRTQMAGWLARQDLAGIRHAAGMSLDTIAAGVGASHRTVVSRWERRIYTPRGAAGLRYVRLLVKLAEHQAIPETRAGRPAPAQRAAWDPAAYLKGL